MSGEKVASTTPESQTQITEVVKPTSQPEAADLLRNLREHGFASSNEQLAIALGRPASEIKA